MMHTIYSGFEEDHFPTIAIPSQFVEEWMWDLNDAIELKVLLTIFRKFQLMDGSVKSVRLEELLEDKPLIHIFPEEGMRRNKVMEILGKLVERGFILTGKIMIKDTEATLIFLNTPLGRAAIQAISEGRWKVIPTSSRELQPPTLPNIFQLYEQHIGPLTPMLVDTLKDAELSYSSIWIEEAIRLAVENNKRSWRYIEAILRRWKEEGKGERKTRQDAEEAIREYAEQWKKPTVPKRRR